MNLLRCHIMGFGKLSNLEIAFREGLNVIHAPNEGGKTTLQHCLEALLYGQLRPDLKARKYLDPWVEQYKPWRGSEYGGILWCRMASGNQIEIQRNFGKDGGAVVIRSGAGEDITDSYDLQRNGDILFAQAHLDLPKDLFESIAMIRENQLDDLGGTDTLRERIANLAQSGDEELSVHQSFRSLEDALAAIGTERAATKPYRRALDRLELLRTEQAELEAHRWEYQQCLVERRTLSVEMENLEKALLSAQRSALAARRRETMERVRILGDMDSQLSRLRQEIDSSTGNLDFPLHRLEELEQLVGGCDVAGKSLRDLRAKIQNAEARLSGILLESAGLEPFGRLQSSPDAEKITEWFVSYLGSSIQKEEILRKVARLKEELAGHEEALSRVNASLRDPALDWRRKTLEAAERERSNSGECLALASRCSEQKAALASAKGKRRLHQLLALILLLAASATAAGTLLHYPLPLPALMANGLSLLALAAGAFLWMLASRSRAVGKQLMQSITLAAAEQSRLQQDTEEAFVDIRRIMAHSGLKSIDAFMNEVERANSCAQRIDLLRANLREEEQRREQAVAECDGFHGRLRDSLACVGLSCSRADLRAKVDVLRAGLRRYRESEAKRQNCLQEIESLRLEERMMVSELEDKQVHLQDILKSGGVSSADTFREGCRARQQLLELREKESSCAREYRRHSENLTLTQWTDRLHDLEVREMSIAKAQDLPDHARGSHDAGINSPLLPYLPSTEEAEMEVGNVAASLAAAREKHAVLVGTLRQAFSNYRTVAEIEEDLAQTESELQGMELNRKALELALNTLRTLAKERHSVLVPQLNCAVERRFLRICPGHYLEVKIDPDFRILVREAVNAELRPAEVLSRGTQDQIYFSLRFGILDLLSNPAEPCPCLLDEPFAAYDNCRLNEVFSIMEEEARRRQLILFTCREDIRDLALQRGGHSIQLQKNQ